MTMLVCLPCCLLLSGLLLSLASVSFQNCEDSFVYVRLSSSWTRSSSYRDYRQDDHYPWYHFYLCLLVASFYRYAALPTTCLSFLPYCHVKPLTHLPSKPLFGYVAACSAPLIVLLVAGAVEDCSMRDRIMLGYHNISYLINASIYLVKGGRLGLMPGVLFHSCRPSFRHTGVVSASSATPSWFWSIDG